MEWLIIILVVFAAILLVFAGGWLFFTDKGRDILQEVFEIIEVVMGLILFAGWIKWAIMAWNFKSWSMALVLILPPVAALVGLHSLIFETPDWVYRVFG